ncbi:MAG TPA: OmpA family protein, partial [Polyangia bacterium]|nr:OmpA family protein [Polyangia bacterium]
NLDLSRRRAASVMRWLAEHGIDSGRMTSDGFGQEQPIDDNRTKAGRAGNRRVEFHITKQ